MIESAKDEASDRYDLRERIPLLILSPIEESADKVLDLETFLGIGAAHESMNSFRPCAGPEGPVLIGADADPVLCGADAGAAYRKLRGMGSSS